MAGKRRFDDDTIAVALQMIVAGATIGEAAQATGISKTWIQIQFKASGLVRRRPPRHGRKGASAEVVRSALQAVARGAHIKEAAALLHPQATGVSNRDCSTDVSAQHHRTFHPHTTQCDW